MFSSKVTAHGGASGVPPEARLHAVRSSPADHWRCFIAVMRHVLRCKGGGARAWRCAVDEPDSGWSSRDTMTAGPAHSGSAQSSECCCCGAHYYTIWLACHCNVTTAVRQA